MALPQDRPRPPLAPPPRRQAPPTRLEPLERFREWWAGQSGPNRATVIGGLLIVLGALGGVVFALASALGDDPAAVRQPDSTAGPAVVATVAPDAPVLEGTRDAAEEGFIEYPGPSDPTLRLPLVRNLADLAKYAEPPNSSFARLRIPSLNVTAPVAAYDVGSDGVMLAPSGPAGAAWYDLGDFGMGGTPGAGGNAVFSAHVDYNDVVPYAEVRYNGPAVFFNLNKLSPGDIIEVDFRGQSLRYAVEWRRTVGESSEGWDEILTNSVPRDSITLITCGGAFDIKTRSYESRTVVRAVRL
jgi:sortase (surface protein transpeptidase)